MNSRFHTLCLSDTIDCRAENEYLKLKLRREPMLWASDVSSACSLVRAGGGEYLHTLIVGMRKYRRGRILPEFEVTDCNNITLNDNFPISSDDLLR